MSYAGTNQRGMDMLSMLIEQWKFAAGLGKTSQQIAPLRRVGLATQSLSQRLLATLRAKLGLLRQSHARTFLLLKLIELLFNAVERKMNRVKTP